jgi:hypothetical protein
LTEFGSELRRRIQQTVTDLADARASGDDYLVEVRLGELESLARVAAEHGITVDGVEESLSRHGLATPSAGVPLLVDLSGPSDRSHPSGLPEAPVVQQSSAGGMAAG